LIHVLSCNIYFRLLRRNNKLKINSFLTNIWRNNWRSIIDVVENLGYRHISQLLNELTLEVIYNLLSFWLRTEFLRAEKLTSFLTSAIVLDCCPWNSSSGFVFTLWPDKKMANDYQKFFEFLEENTIFHLVLSVVLFLAKKTEEN
jgi:hypothetical protein